MGNGPCFRDCPSVDHPCLIVEDRGDPVSSLHPRKSSTAGYLWYGEFHLYLRAKIGILIRDVERWHSRMPEPVPPWNVFEIWARALRWISGRECAPRSQLEQEKARRIGRERVSAISSVVPLSQGQPTVGHLTSDHLIQ
jgi:hypothetical protein